MTGQKLTIIAFVLIGGLLLIGVQGYAFQGDLKGKVALRSVAFTSGYHKVWNRGGYPGYYYHRGRPFYGRPWYPHYRPYYNYWYPRYYGYYYPPAYAYPYPYPSPYYSYPPYGGYYGGPSFFFGLRIR